jgi:DNA invertase Pin-like site-specific DNA recombinase
VSTLDQNLSAQLDALKAAGAVKLYSEKVSGVRADRPQLAKLMARLEPGDTVLVTKLDRLGRSTRELLDLIDRMAKVGAAFRSLGDPLFDTSNSHGKLVLGMLAVISEFERDLIRERTGEGRKHGFAGLPASHGRCRSGDCGRLPGRDQYASGPPRLGGLVWGSRREGHGQPSVAQSEE